MGTGSSMGRVKMNALKSTWVLEFSSTASATAIHFLRKGCSAWMSYWVSVASKCVLCGVEQVWTCLNPQMGHWCHLVQGQRNIPEEGVEVPPKSKILQSGGSEAGAGWEEGSGGGGE